MFKIIQTIHFLYLDVGKTTSRWTFERKSKNQNVSFNLKKQFQYFSRTHMQALEKKIYFGKFVK